MSLQERFIESLSRWNTSDLKSELAKLRLSSTGNKAQLIQRLQTHLRKNDPALQPPELSMNSVSVNSDNPTCISSNVSIANSINDNIATIETTHSSDSPHRHNVSTTPHLNNHNESTSVSGPSQLFRNSGFEQRDGFSLPSHSIRERPEGPGNRDFFHGGQQPQPHVFEQRVGFSLPSHLAGGLPGGPGSRYLNNRSGDQYIQPYGMDQRDGFSLPLSQVTPYTHSSPGEVMNSHTAIAQTPVIMHSVTQTLPTWSRPRFSTHLAPQEPPYSSSYTLHHPDIGSTYPSNSSHLHLHAGSTAVLAPPHTLNPLGGNANHGQQFSSIRSNAHHIGLTHLSRAYEHHPINEYHINRHSMLPTPNFGPNLASTQLNHPCPDSQAELTALETQLKILRTKEQIRDCEFRLSRAPEELSHSDENSSMLQLVKQSVDIHSLPPAKPFKFSGDVIEYPKWRAMFELMVESKEILPHQKLIYLEDYLAGEALDAVKGYSSLNTAAAYYQARKELDERYGDPLDITEAYRDRLEGWPTIQDHDSKGLRKYADFLGQCMVSMSTIEGLSKLNDPREMKRFPATLPRHLMEKWSRFAGNLRYEAKVHPTFQQYTEFVKKEAFLANNTTTSVEALTSAPTKQASRRKPPARFSSSFNTTVTGNTVTTDQSSEKSIKFICHKCKTSTHNTADCRVLARLSYTQRQEFMKAEKLCFRCLRKGHGTKQCKINVLCKQPNCSGKHATCLHDSNKTTGADKPLSSVSLHTCSEQRSELTTMILPVYISSPDAPHQEVLVYALVDNMSDTSFIRAETAATIMTESTPVKVKMTTMTTCNKVVSCSKYEHIRVRGMFSDEVITVDTTYSLETIPGNTAHIPTPETASRWGHLLHIADKIAPRQQCEIALLIGYNCPAASFPLNTIKGEISEPYGIETILGWSIIGGICTQPQPSYIAHKITTEELSPQGILSCLEEDLSTDHNAKPMSQNDFLFLKKLRESITITEGFYTMPLPFKEAPSFPDNRAYAMRRFKCLEGKLTANPQLNGKYHDFMNDIISSGEAEVCSSAESGWYIPHHGVFHPLKPDKLRVVFDCSATFKGTSLNKQLLQGPDLNNNLAGLLCRFRKDKVAVTCDIKKMFHQFRVNDEHRRYLRFLWYQNGSKDVIDYQMNVHLFGATSSPSCAIFGLKQLATDLAADFPAASKFIHNNFYVDDGLISLPSSAEVIKLMMDTQALTKKGNLVLHKFMSNDQEVAAALGCEGPSTKELSSPTSACRALGLVWNIEEDCFSFSISSKNNPHTRRGVLATIAAIFDPLGLLTPFTLKGKLILQSICSDGKGWDDPLNVDHMKEWLLWYNCLKHLHDLKFPRCFLENMEQPLKVTELHIFSDASQSGYGVGAYIRLVTGEGNTVTVRLVMGKSRVSPRKPTTIPRLELQAATLAVKVGDFLKQELQYPNLPTYYWTDSETVLGYISNESKRFHIFVANRVQRIRESSAPEQWNYVNTAENPADTASRGSTVSQIPRIWYEGPEFLKDPSFTPPKQEKEFPVNPTDPEIRKVFSHSISTKEDESFITYFNKFGTWKRATKSIWNLLKPLHCHRRINSHPNSPAVFKAIIKLLQHSYFPEEVNKLQRGQPVSKESKLFKLDPFLDGDNLIRVGGRLQDLISNDGIKHPVVMPGKAHLTKLFILQQHVDAAHQGKLTTLHHIRSSGVFLIGQGNKTVASVIQKCVLCKRLRGQPIKQKMADLPSERTEPSPPFTYVGVDVFGPFFCKDGRRENKRYGLIFCCLSSRAVHIELLDDMTTDCFINSFRCFTAIRGPVKTLFSDQGTNFVGAKHEFERSLQEIIDQNLKEFLKSNHCEFKFNVPSASHMGGSWERLIRGVRDIMRGILIEKHTSRIDTTGLRTILYEIMAIMNARPLTSETLRQETSIEPIPLSPNMLLTMKQRSITSPPGEFSESDLYSKKRWRRIQFISEQFWSRWRIEYLKELQYRQKWNKVQRNVHVNDVVLLVDNNEARSNWKLARVIKTYPSQDGLVRKVRLFLGADKEELERPVHKLVMFMPASD